MVINYKDKTATSLLNQWKKRLEQVMSEQLPLADTHPRRLHQAIRYASLNGGKRVRGLLVYATGHLLEAKEELLDIPACAIEAIQCFSLVHDDLPALDNDDLRRGKLACHKAFDEATAILVGDALQMFAFEQLSKTSQPAIQRLAMIRILAEYSGSRGMIGGGYFELEISGKAISFKELEALHWLKCGKLIHASVLLGAYGATNPDKEILDKLEKYAYGLGGGYQISNDLLDSMGNLEFLGKSPKSDQSAGRTTFFTEFDVETAKQRMIDLFDSSIAALDGLKRAEPLRQITEQVKQRSLSVFH